MGVYLGNTTFDEYKWELRNNYITAILQIFYILFSQEFSHNGLGKSQSAICNYKGAIAVFDRRNQRPHKELIF